ncbi:MAG TPA: DUF2071 domain-containing protein [Acidobacteriaceae bacterium]|jgi:hypothetical protein|nr:DUF2071 domain-containing protein [Acidobacteriaceae bacterium]
MNKILSTTEHRPWPMPKSRWVMTQRWNDLLFAHWPLPPSELTHLLPEGLAVDTFDGSAWVGVVPFWMDQVRMRGLPRIPGTSRFPELNLRTYVRERHSNQPGVYFFSLDAANPLAVATARVFFRLPYYWARMKIETSEGRGIEYSSERLLVKPRAQLHVRYRSLGKPCVKGGIESFLTDRYALFTTTRKGGTARVNIHHLPWPLEMAEAEFDRNELPEAHGIHLPDTRPLLQYSRELTVYIWSLDELPSWSARRAAAPVPAAGGD